MPAIPYSLFFRQALYGPGGYYSQDKPRVGRSRATDFFTSSSLPLFPKLLAQAFHTLAQLHRLERPALIELGNEPAKPLFPLPPENFRAALNFPLGTLDKFSAPEPSIIFSNELFDAQPIDRLCKTKDGWELLGLDPERKILDVVIEDEKNAWDALRLKEISAFLPDHFAEGAIIDVSLDALRLIDQIFSDKKEIGITQTQLFIAFDYGLTLQSLAENPRPTARAYHQHSSLTIAEALALPMGSYDLTHHVVWDLLADRLRAHSFSVQPLMTQEAFFVHYAAGSFPTLTPDERRSLATLLHPAHMGAAFQVMIAVR